MDTTLPTRLPGILETSSIKIAVIPTWDAVPKRGYVGITERGLDLLSPAITVCLP